MSTGLVMSNPLGWRMRWRNRTLVLSVASSANLLAQFALQMVPLALEGVSAVTDALYLGLLPLLFLQAVVTTNLQHVVVPTYAYRFEERSDRYWRSAVPILSAGTLVAALVTAATYGAHAAGWLSVDEVGREVFVDTLAVGVLAMAFNLASGYLATGAYLADRYVAAELASLCCSLIALATLPFLLSWKGVSGVAWAICLRWGANVIAGLMLVPRPNEIREGPNDARAMLRTGWQLFAGNALIRSDLFTDRILAALTPAGNLSMLHTVQLGVAGVNSVVNRAVVAPGLRRMTIAIENGDLHLLARIATDLTQTAWRVFAVAVLAVSVAWIVVWVAPELSIASLPMSSWLATATPLLGLLLGGILGSAFSAVFFAKRNTRTPMLVSIGTYFVSIATKIGALYLFGFQGLLVALSLHSLLNAAIFRHLLRHGRSRS